MSERFIKEYFADAKAINVEEATVHPRVSQSMDDIIGFVKDLVDKGYAYEVDGDVYFSARKFEGYGKLSGQNIDDLESGARIMVEEKKKDPWISPFGRRGSRKTKLPGSHRGVWEDPAGTSSAPPCRENTWETAWTSTPAAKT